MKQHLPRGLAQLALGVLIVLLSATGAFAQVAKWKFFVVGDTRGTSSTTDQINSPILAELATVIARERPAFVLVPGDLVSSGTLAAFQDWKRIMAPAYKAGVAIYPVMGNHDASDVNAFKAVFGADIPDNGPTGEIDRTYAVTYANALVLVLDTYVNTGRVNQAWIDKMLADNTRPHVFAMGHMPAFKVIHADCLDDYATQRDTFWNSLKKAGGRAYFAGHDHIYDNMRLDDGDGNPDNDLHQLILGTGGAPFHGDGSYDGDNGAWTPRRVYHEAQYGYTQVDVDGYHVTMTWYHRTGANSYAATGETWSYTVPAPPAAPKVTP